MGTLELMLYFYTGFLGALNCGRIWKMGKKGIYNLVLLRNGMMLQGNAVDISQASYTFFFKKCISALASVDQ